MRMSLILVGATMAGWGIAAATGQFDFALKEHFRPPELTDYDAPVLTHARHALIHWTGLLGIVAGGALVLTGLEKKRH